MRICGGGTREGKYANNTRVHAPRKVPRHGPGLGHNDLVVHPQRAPHCTHQLASG